MTMGRVVLGSVRRLAKHKQGKQAAKWCSSMGSASVSASSSCPGFLSWWPGNCESNKPFPPEVSFGQCSITIGAGQECKEPSG